MKPILVSFEGCHGCGKTILSTRVAEQLGWVRRKSPSGAFGSARHHFDLQGVSTDERSAFYAGDVIASSAFAKHHMDAGRSVVLDRYFHSTIIYSRLDGEPWENIWRGILQPDLVLFITRPYREIRLKQEDMSTNDALHSGVAEYHRNEHDYRQLLQRWNTVEIHNDGTLEESADACMEAIRRELPKHEPLPR